MSSSFAVDRLELDVHRDPRFLPYEIIEHDQINLTDREPTYNLAQVARPAVGDTGTAIYSVSCNPTIGFDVFAQVNLNAFPSRSIPYDTPVRLIVRHHVPFEVPGSSLPCVVGGGTRNDSAFIFVARPDSGVRYQFLTSGKDITGNGEWSSDVLICLVADYDFDGVPEAIVKTNPYRDKVPSRLFCVSLADLSIEWQFDYFLSVAPDRIWSSPDTSCPAVIIATVGSGHGLVDTLINDEYGYLTIIDRAGVVTSNHVISYFGQSAFSAPGLTPGTMLVAHCLPFLDPNHLPDTVKLQPALSISRMDGTPIRTIPLVNQVRSLVAGDYDGDGTMEIIAGTSDFGLQVYDSTLTLVAESPKCAIEWISGILPTLDGNGRTIVFGTSDGSFFTNERLEPLAFASSNAQAISALGVASDGTLRSILESSGTKCTLSYIRRRSFVDYITVAYVKYQNYFIAGLSSLLIGLLVTNYYRSRVTRQKRALEAAHTELAETHQALKEAQAQIVAQEKYRQAKDIAGGFAHEIRNALLPAEIAIDRSQTVTPQQSSDTDRLNSYLQAASKSVARAISITELISQYTKIDSHYLPEFVSLGSVLSKVMEAYRLQIEGQDVKIDISGPTDICVNGNSPQYEMVFTNLLLNSLDALDGRESPLIRIVASVENDNLNVEFFDNGIGIAAPDIGRVFETFFSTKPNKGTGLGLATAKKIIELYGGSLSVHSTPGIETRFMLTFKISQCSQTGHRSDMGDHRRYV